jgi:alkylation response protein AidB-like acyl-CoA dehydrogenase
VPEGPTALDRARSLHELISGEARESEALGCLTDTVVRGLLDSGLFGLLLPRSAGGLGASIPEYFEAIENIGSADGSAAWCLTICSATNFMVFSGAPAQARQEIFGQGPVAMWTGLLPRATSQLAEGGYLVSGKFGWGSGSSLADWVLVTESLPDREGQQWFRSYALPKCDVTIVPDSWQVMGLKATASVDYVIDGAFVPAHRSFEYPLMDLPDVAPISTVGSAAIHQIGMAAFASGVARRAIAELVATATEVRRMKALTSQVEDAAIQQGLGEVQARFDAARGHYLALLAEQDSHLGQHGRTSRPISEHCMFAVNVLAQAAREATVFAFDNAATGAIRLDDPLQRCLRDLFAGMKHPTFGAIHLRSLGREKMGVDALTLRF